MTTPSIIPVSNNNNIDALLEKASWAATIGAATTLTYSIPQGTAFWASDYGSTEPDSWSALNTEQSTAFRQALGAWSEVANIQFTEVADAICLGLKCILLFFDNSIIIAM